MLFIIRAIILFGDGQLVDLTLILFQILSL